MQNEIADKILWSLKNEPEKWSYGEHRDCDGLPYVLVKGVFDPWTLANSMIELWVCSGFWFFSVRRPYRVYFSLWDRLRCWLAYLEWRRKTGAWKEIKQQPSLQLKKEAMEVLEALNAE